MHVHSIAYQILHSTSEDNTSTNNLGPIVRIASKVETIDEIMETIRHPHVRRYAVSREIESGAMTCNVSRGSIIQLLLVKREIQNEEPTRMAVLHTGSANLVFAFIFSVEWKFKFLAPNSKLIMSLTHLVLQLFLLGWVLSRELSIEPIADMRRGHGR